jgi:3-phenylpropionate/trans-cinnamate dioxygenase ferredoxin component
MTAFVDVLADADIPAGQQRTVRVGLTRILLVRSEIDLHAIPDQCPHALKPLFGGELNGTIFKCPSHGAQFDLVTGRPVNAVADRALTPYPVRVRDGRIEVCVN